MLRTEAGRDPYDKDLAGLVGELSTRSDEFRVLGDQNVSAPLLMAIAATSGWPPCSATSHPARPPSPR